MKQDVMSDNLKHTFINLRVCFGFSQSEATKRLGVKIQTLIS